MKEVNLLIKLAPSMMGIVTSRTQEQKAH